MREKVAILGGGIAGLSAAHELSERGFRVEVYERRPGAGGKARSVRVQQPQVVHATQRPPLPRARSWLPGEHGFRFFPGFYKHVTDTMRRIPYGAHCVHDNLVDTTEIQIARYDQAPTSLPARFPMRPEELRSGISFALGLIGERLGVSAAETSFFAARVWQLFTSCEQRRNEEYEALDWWSFVQAERHSLGYQQLYANGITRSLVAAKAERASTKTIGNIFLQMMLSIIQPGEAADRVLNGPTNDVWIDPWLDYLTARGVVYHTNAEVQQLNFEQGHIHSVTVSLQGRLTQIEADYFVAALPVERMALLVTPELAAADPALGRLSDLSKYVEWMNGVQFYLARDVPIAHGHTIFLDSPWAITSVSQAQFWPAFSPRSFGQGDVAGILSVDISDWDVPGSLGKTAQQCSREEIRDEVWHQLKRSLNVAGQTRLRDEDLLYWVLDDDIIDSDPKLPGFETNAEPLLVNYVDTWRLRPDAVSSVPNLFIASDYVRTNTDLATMEAANEAARRAVNGILTATGVSADPCRVWQLREPEPFAPLRAYDARRYARGEPWDATAIDLAYHALRMSTAADRATAAGAVAAPALALAERMAQDASALLEPQPIAAGVSEHPEVAPSEATTADEPSGRWPRVRILAG